MQAADKIRHWRKLNKLTQVQLATKLGRRQSTISRAENGGQVEWDLKVALHELTEGFVSFSDWIETVPGMSLSRSATASDEEGHLS
ncbi:hypothetical protein DLJ53_21950 [Acuticoccus sediminis]|uniref:HTH cro/C1-type domain-containing protein n=1 Tax=Acuticoccus sediminis TaxID=2184697 RepID=A0A8B2NQC0_9HYPH|nr:hypothetical protein DLJ53_21950 [Acuticoccus sediminis]